jgi:hypothetical protein
VVHSPRGAVGHVAAPKLPSQGGRAQSHMTHGSVRAQLSKEARSGAVGHVVALEPTSSTGRCGPMLHHTWQRMDTRTAPCLDLDELKGNELSQNRFIINQVSTSSKEACEYKDELKGNDTKINMMKLD